MDRDTMNTFFHLVHQNEKAAEETDNQQVDKGDYDYDSISLTVLAGLGSIILLSAWIFFLI